MDKTKQFGAGDRVRIDIPDERDPDFAPFVAILSDASTPEEARP